MLLPADVDIVARDSALPGLATLLDPEALAAVLRKACPGADIAEVKLAKIHYSPAKSCRAVIKVTTGDQRLRVYARAQKKGASDRGTRLSPSLAAPTPLGLHRVYLEDLATVFTVFPWDDELSAPWQFSDASLQGTELRRLLPERPELWDAAPQVLHYVPSKRFVIRLNGETGPKAVLKFYAGADFQKAKQVAASDLSSRGALRVVRRVACSEPDGMLAYDWLEGRSLAETVLAGNAGLQDVARVGAALAALHGMEPGGLANRGGRSNATWLGSIARWIGILCPDLASRVDRLARALVDRLEARAMTPVLVHGNFHQGQTLILDDGAAILDLDTVMIGDPALDLGCLMGDLDAMVLKGLLSAERRDLVKGVLINGYRSSGGKADSAVIDLYTAVDLLWLAKGPFRKRLPDWPERMGVIVARAEQLADATLPWG